MEKLFSRSCLLICFFLQCPIIVSWRNLQFLDLGSNLLEGPLPSSLCNLESLNYLLLSNNSFDGTIPDCFGSLQLVVLDLKNNGFHGMIPTTFPEGNRLRNLGLNGNQLEGSLPKSLLNCASLEVLDLGNNKIRDTFPIWLETLPVLSVLILKSNQLHGTIPASSINQSSFQKLRILDISYNGFSGFLPAKMIKNFQAMKWNDSSSSQQPQYMGDNLYYVDSVTITMKGLEIELTRILKIFTTIDLSGNDFGGSIPDSIGELTSLKVLNFSHNQFGGSIPSTIGDLSQLESLDLSCNQFQGKIPAELGKLNFLSALNLSQNHLVGRIPQGGQFNTFNSTSFSGNAGLCGFPLEKCADLVQGSEATSGLKDHKKDYLDFTIGFTWKPVVLGFGFGMVIGLLMGGGTLYTQKPSWLNEIAEDLYRQSRRRSRTKGPKWLKIRDH